jgi:hypothetical protein
MPEMSMTEPVLPQPIPAEAVSEEQEDASDETIVVRVSVRSPHAVCSGTAEHGTPSVPNNDQRRTESAAPAWQRALTIIGSVLEIALGVARRWFSHGP